jgi:predicted NBD/HSP70 family sugar kinase
MSLADRGFPLSVVLDDMATSSYLRRMNQRRIIEAVVRVRRVSRAELARVSGMSQPTVSRIVDELLKRGILMEGDNHSDAALPAPNPTKARAPRTASVGRPSTPLELDRRKPRFVGLQLGVRKTRLTLLPLAIPQADRWDYEFDTPTTYDAWSRQLSQVWRAVEVKGIKTVVTCMPGVIDEKAGRVFLSPNLRWTEHADLGETLRDVFKSPVLFIQEIRALALGQLALDHDLGDFLLVDSGSGVGAAAITGGRLYTGPLPLSGELGHTPVLGNDRRCGCGAIGCVETLVSRKGLLATAAQENPALKTWPDLLSFLADKPSPPWLRRSLDAAAIVIASALNVMGLRQVILTGGLAELPPSAIDYLSERISADAMWARFGTITCRTAVRHRQAGMVSLAIERTLLVPRAH